MATLAVLLLCPSTALFAQYYGIAPTPRDQTEADRMRTEVENEPIPQDPGLVYDASKEARASSEYYRSIQHAIPDQLQRLEENKKKFHEQVTVLRGLAKNPKECAKKETFDNIGGALRNFYGLLTPVSDQSSYDLVVFPKTREEIDRLYNIAGPAQVCQELGGSANAIALDTIFDTENDGIQKKLNDRKSYDLALQSAWDARMAKLNQSLTQQKQAFDILRALPWVVVLLCLFSLFVLLSVRFFSPAIQMELVGSGQIVQFPTVMALLVVVVALGLPGILKENTLAALLGGIGGYVLSQGVGRAAAREGERRGRQAATGGAVSTIDSLLVSPANSSVAVGASQTFSAVGTSPEGNTSDVSTLVSWSTSDDTIAKLVDSSGPQAVVSGVAKGKAVVTASLNGVTGKANIVVS